MGGPALHQAEAFTDPLNRFVLIWRERGCSQINEQSS